MGREAGEEGKGGAREGLCSRLLPLHYTHRNASFANRYKSTIAAVADPRVLSPNRSSSDPVVCYQGEVFEALELIWHKPNTESLVKDNIRAHTPPLPQIFAASDFSPEKHAFINKALNKGGRTLTDTSDGWCKEGNVKSVESVTSSDSANESPPDEAVTDPTHHHDSAIPSGAREKASEEHLLRGGLLPMPRHLCRNAPVLENKASFLSCGLTTRSGESALTSQLWECQSFQAKRSGLVEIDIFPVVFASDSPLVYALVCHVRMALLVPLSLCGRPLTFTVACDLQREATEATGGRMTSRLPLLVTRPLALTTCLVDAEAQHLIVQAEFHSGGEGGQGGGEEREIVIESLFARSAQALDDSVFPLTLAAGEQYCFSLNMLRTASGSATGTGTGFGAGTGAGADSFSLSVRWRRARSANSVYMQVAAYKEVNGRLPGSLIPGRGDGGSKTRIGAAANAPSIGSKIASGNGIAAGKGGTNAPASGGEERAGGERDGGEEGLGREGVASGEAERDSLADSGDSEGESDGGENWGRRSSVRGASASASASAFPRYGSSTETMADTGDEANADDVVSNGVSGVSNLILDMKFHGVDKTPLTASETSFAVNSLAHAPSRETLLRGSLSVTIATAAGTRNNSRKKDVPLTLADGEASSASVPSDLLARLDIVLLMPSALTCLHKENRENEVPPPSDVAAVLEDIPGLKTRIRKVFEKGRDDTSSWRADPRRYAHPRDHEKYNFSAALKSPGTGGRLPRQDENLEGGDEEIVWLDPEDTGSCPYSAADFDKCALAPLYWTGGDSLSSPAELASPGDLPSPGELSSPSELASPTELASAAIRKLARTIANHMRASCGEGELRQADRAARSLQFLSPYIRLDKARPQPGPGTTVCENVAKGPRVDFALPVYGNEKCTDYPTFYVIETHTLSLFAIHPEFFQSYTT